MRLVLLIVGAVVAQVWHEDDPQDDATRQLWFEEAREAVLDMDENFAASYDARASAQSQAAIARQSQMFLRGPAEPGECFRREGAA